GLSSFLRATTFQSGSYASTPEIRDRQNLKRELVFEGNDLKKCPFMTSREGLGIGKWARGSKLYGLRSWIRARRYSILRAETSKSSFDFQILRRVASNSSLGPRPQHHSAGR